VSGSATCILDKVHIQSDRKLCNALGVFSVALSYLTVWECIGAWGHVRAQEKQICMFPGKILRI